MSPADDAVTIEYRDPRAKRARGRAFEFGLYQDKQRLLSCSPTIQSGLCGHAVDFNHASFDV
jgi:hypothetical protein